MVPRAASPRMCSPIWPPRCSAKDRDPMLAAALSALTWILPFLFVLTLIVTVHELGHFMAAKACGVAIDRFSIGFGRAIVHWRDRAGVEWRIGWLPLGGYVRFSGDDNAASVPDTDD